MRIGYCVEGSTDRALLKGLRERWCPKAEMVEGRFRGPQLKRRDMPKACLELQYKGVDVIVMLRDANTEEWRVVLDRDRKSCPSEQQHLVVFAVCDRNVECWLTADPNYAASQTGVPPQRFQVPDPKGAFEDAMKISSLERKEPEIADFTKNAPLHNWLANKSFEDFYEQLRQKSKEMACGIENLRDV